LRPQALLIAQLSSFHLHSSTAHCPAFARRSRGSLGCNAQDVAHSDAQCHPDANSARPARNGVSDEPEDPGGREDDRQHPEHSENRGGHANVGERFSQGDAGLQK